MKSPKDWTISFVARSQGLTLFMPTLWIISSVNLIHLLKALLPPKGSWTVTNRNTSSWPEERAVVLFIYLFIYLWFAGVTPVGNSAASFIISYVSFRTIYISAFSRIPSQSYTLSKWSVETDVQTPSPTNSTSQYSESESESESEPELLYDWRFNENQFVLATSPFRLTTSILFNWTLAVIVLIWHPIWREDGSVVYNSCWTSPAQSFLWHLYVVEMLDR
jgi:hypothetical protein